MGALMRSHDWSNTPLGPVSGWAQSLRTVVSVCLSSRFPLQVCWGPDLVMIYNDAYRPILGTDKHPYALGRPYRDVFPEIWDVMGPMLTGVLRGEEATWSEDQMLVLVRNGFPEECYFTFSSSPIRDESGGVGGAFVAVTETTARVLNERRLRTLRDLASRSSEAKDYESACRIAASVLDTNRNDVAFTLLYVPDEDGETLRLAGLSGIRENTAASPLEISLTDQSPRTAGWPFAVVAQRGEPVLVEEPSRLFGELPGGAWPEPPRSALVLPLTLPGKPAPAGYCVVAPSPRLHLDREYRTFFDLIAREITDSFSEALAWKQERERLETLARLDRAKTTFFSDVSHEFRTPLTLILDPVAELLEDANGSLSSHARDLLRVVHRNTLRLLKIVNSLLDFSRIEAGRVSARYMPTDLAALTTDLCGLFRSAIERAGLRLETDLLPLPGPVFVDRDMWEKIVTNLVSNAFKYTFEGEIAVSLRAEDGRVVLRVSDTGVGIPAEQIPHLFERFQRVEAGRGRTSEGTGIGLALVQELVKCHGGEVSVESEPGRGSAFTVTIPLGCDHLPTDHVVPAPDATPPLASQNPHVEEALYCGAAESAGATEGPEPAAGIAQTDGARILVIDDNADMRDYLARILGRRWIVETATNGRDALDKVRSRAPDLVLTDVMMPEIDGIGLLRVLRANPVTRTLPILLLSARAGEEARVRGLEAECDDYIEKPFTARELLVRVGSQLALARVRGRVEESLRHHQLLLEGRAEQGASDLLRTVHALEREVDERARAEAHVKLQARQLRGLTETALRVHTTLVVREILRIVTEDARTIIGAHQSKTLIEFDALPEKSIQHVSLSEEHADWRASGAGSVSPEVQRLVSEGGGLVRMTRAELEAHPSRLAIENDSGFRAPMRGWLAARLASADGRTLGLIQLSDGVEGDFTRNDEALLGQLAQIVAAAIENAILFDQIAAAQRGLATLSRRLLEVQETERRAIVRELHDEIGQYLTGLRMSLEAGVKMTPARMRGRIKEAVVLVNEATERVRQLALNLRPTLLDDLGLVQALAWHIERYTAQTGIQVSFDAADLEERPPIEVETAAYRLVQEALTNVARHAHVREASVVLRVESGALAITVTDRGIGFNPEAAVAAGQSSGLSGMRERAMLLGGKFEMTSGPGIGTRMHARIPFHLT